MGAKRLIAEEPQDCVEVTIFRDKKVQKKFVSARVFVIGRAVDCDVQVLDPKISRLHLQVEVDELNRIFVTDCSSSGSLISRQKIPTMTRIQIQISDRVGIGDTEISFLSLFVRADTVSVAAIPVRDSNELAPTMVLEPIRAPVAVAPEPATTDPLLNVPVTESVPHSDPAFGTPSAGIPTPLAAPRSLDPEPQTVPVPSSAFGAKPGSVPVLREPTTLEEREAILTTAREQALEILKEAEQKAFKANESYFQKARATLNDARSEAERLIEKAREEVRELRNSQLEENKKSADEALHWIEENRAKETLETQRLISQRETHAQELLKQTRSEVERLREKDKLERDRMLEGARAEAARVLDTANSEARKKQENIQALLLKTDEDIKTMREEGMKESELLKAKARVDAAHAEKMIDAIQKEAQSFLERARAESNVLKNEAATECERRLKQSVEHADQLCAKALAEAELIKKSAFADAEKFMTDAIDKSKKAHNDAVDEIVRLRLLHERECEVRARQSVEEARLMADRDLAEIRKKIQAEEERFQLDIEQHRKLVDDQKAEVARVQRESMAELYRVQEEAKAIFDRSQSEATSEFNQLKSVATAELQRLQSESQKTATELDLFKTEIEQLRSTHKKELAEIQQKIATEKNGAQESAKQIAALDIQHRSLQEKVVLLRSESDQLQNGLKNRVAEIEQQVKVAQDRARQTVLDIEKQREEKVRVLIQENEREADRFQAVVLQTLRDQKDTLAQMVHQKVWKSLLADIPPEVYPNLEKKTLHEIDSAFEDHFANASAMFIDQKTAFRRQNQRNTRWVVTGVMLGAMLVGAMWFVKERATSANLAMELEHERKVREAQMAARRFEPPQDDQVRDTYTQAVIYTRDFVTIFADDSIQAKWLSFITKSMYQKWKIDEDTTVRVVAMSQSLVKLLDEKKRNIHPDFVKENIVKMQELENETVAKMKEALGTNVKFEAFKKAEIKFVTDLKKGAVPAP